MAFCKEEISVACRHGALLTWSQLCRPDTQQQDPEFDNRLASLRSQSESRPKVLSCTTTVSDHMCVCIDFQFPSEAHLRSCFQQLSKYVEFLVICGVEVLQNIQELSQTPDGQKAVYVCKD